MRYWSPFWSLLFALAAIFSVGIFVYAPFSPDWWLPNDPARPYQSSRPSAARSTTSS